MDNFESFEAWCLVNDVNLTYLHADVFFPGIIAARLHH